MEPEITRDNHYIAQWYQRGFLAPSQVQLQYLDMMPDQKALDGGRIVTMKALTQRGPKACFYETDLYSTRFGSVVSDEIEKLLFGPIDDNGAIAVRSFIDDDPVKMHDTFQDFFEYLDSQRLRTPKGLDWIRSRYANLDQHRLMREMQALRLMNTMMWMEGVREVVSAEDSDVKFIVSDHPVTIFNAACPADSVECAYPEDPPLEWLGSITVFPLDANNCIIFTHLEYAQEPERQDLRLARTNARYRGHGLARTDAFIRGRRLSREEVLQVNHLIKRRARRFIAAGNRDWLYPEKEVSESWQHIAMTLLPKGELWKFGGEIFVGYEDGSTQYQDAFGRTSRAHEWLRRDGPPVDPGPEDKCGCGSGHAFSRCCMGVPTEGRPSWKVLSIRERNLILCRALRGILGMSDGKSWVDVRRDISDDQVIRIHELFQGLWPADTNLAELLPRPRKDNFRSVYLGVADPQTVEAVALGWLPYFDEIVIANPFMNPGRVRPEFSPTKSPSQYKAQTIRNAVFMFMVETYIDAGLVHVVPDVGDFNQDFGAASMRLAEERTADMKAGAGSFGLLERLKKIEFQRVMLLQPEESLRADFRRSYPEASAEDLEAVVAYSRSMAEADPLALLQRFGKTDNESQLMCMKGYHLESALYLASLMGACIHTEAQAHWDQLQRNGKRSESGVGWSRTAEHLANVEFAVRLDGEARWSDIEAGRFDCARETLRQLATLLQERESPGGDDQLAEAIDAMGRRFDVKYQKDESSDVLTGKLRLSAPQAGFYRDEVQRLLLGFAKATAPATVPFALFMDFGLPDIPEQANQ